MPNLQIYNSNEPFPDRIAKFIHSGYFDGNNHIVTLAVYPIQYLPNQNQLIFYSNINIILEMEATVAPDVTIRNRKPANQLLYDNILESIVENPEDISSYQVKPITNGNNLKLESQFPTYEYVVITTNALKDNFKKFIEWKKRKGIDIGVVTVEDILVNYTQGDLISGINDDAGSIRQYLSYAYSEGTVWALLGGDYSVVPIRYGCGANNYWTSPTYGKLDDYKIPADLYFADFTGDWHVDDDEFLGERNDDNQDYNPEIFVGRLLCSSSLDILIWTEKVIKYEQNPGNGDISYLTKSFMIGADNIRDQMDDVSPLLPASFTHTKWKELPSGLDPNPTFPLGSEVITEMNNKYGLYSWFAHGAPFAAVVKANGSNLPPRWGINVVENFEGNQVSEMNNHLGALTNVNYPSILYSIGCTQTPFDDYEYDLPPEQRNLGEGYTVMYEAGGPAFLGNTRYGWVYSSYKIYKEFANLITLGSNDPESGESYLHIGVAELVSKQNFNDHFLRYSHNLVGCPETQIWTNVPSQFTGYSVTDNTSSITVNAGVSGCDINVRSVDGGFSYNYTASNVTSFTFNTSVRPLIITVNKSQYLPYTAITGGTINTDVTLWGKIHVLGNLTVDVGDNLTLEPGTILSFSGNYSLISYGGLTAIGTPTNPVTFTSTTGSSPNSWGTITLNGSFASGSTISNAKLLYGTQISAINVPQFEISNSSFTDNYKAVYVSGSTGSILNNTITSNSTGHVIELVNWSTVTCSENDITKTNRRGSGILYGGGATGIVSRNDIQGCDWGIGAIWSSSPHSTLSSGLERNNRITNCNYGLKIYRLSYPLFGYGSPSNVSCNSIYGNTVNAAVATSYTTYQSGLTAYGNWWGSYPPNPSLIIVGANGWANYLPGLQYDPWQGISKTNSNETTADIGAENNLDKGIDDLLFPGINLRLQNRYNEAKNFFISHLLKNPNDQQAYVELYNCYCKETSSDLIGFFNLLPKNANNDHKLLLAYLYLKENDIENAKKVNNNIITENPNTSLSIRAKINNLYIALYNENDL